MTLEKELEKLESQLLQQMTKMLRFLDDIKDVYGDAEKCRQKLADFEPELKKSSEIEERIIEIKRQLNIK